jgi:uncharacterized protein YkwD
MRSVESILKKINTLRARHRAPAVHWSAEIAAVAQAWSEKQAATNSFGHSRNPKYGENIYTYAPTDHDFDTAVSKAIDAWSAESSKYDYRHPGFSQETGHFTALVWVSTTSIGVGVAEANGRSYVTMNFAPQGNILGHFKENVLPPTE